jgi:hypothetical protein
VSWDPERLRRGASIGLGRALFQRLTGGIGWKVFSVNTHRPLFWFLEISVLHGHRHGRRDNMAAIDR